MNDYLRTNYIPSRLSLTAGSAEQLRIAVRRFSAYLGRPATLADLNAQTVVDWLREQSLTLSPATVNSRRASILAIWNDAAENGVLGPPPRRLPKARQPGQVPEAWSLEEMQRLVKACRLVPGLWAGCPAALCWHFGVMLIWDTACRLGTLWGAKRQDVDLDHGVWRVPAANIKGRRADRVFRLHSETISLIRESVTDWPDREWLWPFPHGQRQVWPHFRKILKDAGLPTTRRHLFHCLRRTAESHAAAEIGIEQAASIVGHSADVARKHYIAPAIMDQRSLADVLPRI